MADSTHDPIAGLGRMTVPELTALIQAAEAKRAEKMEGAREALLAEFRGKAAELGLSLGALTKAAPRSAGGAARKRRSDAGVKRPARFRNPETGAAWSGRGREPAWLKGKDRAAFAVGE